MKNINKTQSKEFIDKAKQELINLGFKHNSGWDFEVETIVGKIKTTIDINNHFCYSIFSRFEDADRAKKITSCNPYNGKYNLHTGSGETPMNEVMLRINNQFSFLIKNNQKL